MYLTRILPLLLALPLFIVCHAQQTCKATFTGRIVDESNQPVPGATILIGDLGTGQVSDSLGNFRFINLCPGTFGIKVQYLGYQDVVLGVRISGDVSRNIRLTETTTELNEVVVVGHHDAAHTESSLHYVQLNEKELAEAAGKSLGAVLKEIPGVNTIQTGPAIFKPVIHGLHSNRILVLNHGIRQEGQQWGIEHAPEIDPFIASSIVVIKDASAIKYGTDALGGVIVVNPPELPVQAALRGTLITVLQSNSRSATVSGMMEGGIPNRPGWGWRMQGTWKRAGDFCAPDYSLTNTGIKEANFSLATGYHESDKGFDVFFSHFATTLGILKGTAIGNADDLQRAMEREPPEYTTDFSYQITEPRQEVSHNLLKINGHIHTRQGEWRLQYGFQDNRRKEFDIRIGDLSSIPALNLQLSTHTLDGEWETIHNEKRTVSFGWNGMFQNNDNIFGTKRIPFIPDFTNISGGLFTTAKRYINRVTVNLGARYDYRHYDVSGFDFKNSLYQASFQFHNASFSGGAAIELPKDQEIDISLSTAWRPPHVAELYSLGTHQSAAANEYGLLLNDASEVQDIEDTDVKIERAFKAVTTYRREWSRFQLEITPYVNFILNYIYLRPIGVTKTVRGTLPAFKYWQTDALFTGVDFSGIMSVTKNITVIPRASLLRASDVKENEYLINIPSNRFELTARYENVRITSKNFYLQSKLIYTMQQNRAPREITPRQITEAAEEGIDLLENDPSIFDFKAAPEGYFLWNLSAGLTIKQDRVQYNFQVTSENTLDHEYREYTNRLRYYADDLGRNIILSLKCIF